jgi:hypothetical protein
MSIPDDIMESAEEIINDACDAVAGGKIMPVGGWRGELKRAFAKAILDERARCIWVAGKFPISLPMFDNKPMNDLTDDVEEWVRAAIAFAIANPSKAHETTVSPTAKPE